jgi:hypothetical protein
MSTKSDTEIIPSIYSLVFTQYSANTYFFTYIIMNDHSSTQYTEITVVIHDKSVFAEQILASITKNNMSQIWYS